MRAALLWKEWREQRWRCVLGTLVLAVIAASLVRAQLIPLPESLVIVFGPLGLLLAIFLAMGSVATEREDGTWDFLRARPVGIATLLRAKWLIGALNLVVAFVVAGVAAYWAAHSRRLFALPPPPAGVELGPRLLASLGQTVPSLGLLVSVSLVAMLAWYTVLFFILTWARNELHAGLGGVLLTLAALAWMLQYPASRAVWFSDPAVRTVLWTSALLNPWSPAVFILESPVWQAMAVGVALVLWIAVPLWLVGRLERAGRLS